MSIFPRLGLAFDSIKISKSGDTKQAVLSLTSQQHMDEALQQNNIHYQDFKIQVSIANREDFEG